MFDGVHIFDKKREFMTSGYTIMTQADSFVVIKGGSAIKAQINKVQCVGCQKGAYAFAGDDLDQWGGIHERSACRLCHEIRIQDRSLW